VSNNLPDASQKFGKILEVTAYFQKWVNNQQDYAAAFGYQYFSSNCCKMGDRVSVQKPAVLVNLYIVIWNPPHFFLVGLFLTRQLQLDRSYGATTIVTVIPDGRL
jgi:hypothetical protein